MKLPLVAIAVLAAPALIIVLNDLVRLAQWLWRARSSEAMAEIHMHIDQAEAENILRRSKWS